MKGHINRVCFCLILFGAASVYAAQLQLVVIPLKHRSADELIAIIKPLVVKGGTVTGMNNQLILKSTAANINEIKRLLQSIDKAPRRLMITVKQDIDGNINQREHSVSGRYSTGDVTIANSSGRTKNKRGITITKQDDAGNHISYRSHSTRSNIEDKNSFRVQTLEGQPAFIETGQSVPVAKHQTFVTHAGVVSHDTIEYRDVTSGFYVLPRLNGNNVTLTVSPQLSRIHPHQGAVFDIQNIETTVRGQLGEWIQIGAVEQDFDDSNKGILHSTRRHGQEQRSVFVKVEEIQ